MILSNSKNRSLLDKHYFYFGPQPLESATEYKYLGIVFNNRGKLNIAAENLADKARKAYFALKSKLPYSNCIAVEKWVRLFNSLISPIMTYGSEIWISDFNINLDTADKLPFEKVQNMIMKNILGVHGKASNLALRTELELYPVCFISYKLMFKYYARLTDIEVGNNPKFVLLKSAFIEDKKLYTQKSACWVQSLHKLKKLINFDSLQISHNMFEDSLKNFYKCKILGQLENIKSNNTELEKTLKFIEKDSPALAIQYLEKSIKALKERNKLLRIADKYGWDVVDEYIDDPITEGTDDATKLRQADYRAKAKRRDKVRTRPAPYIPEPESPQVPQDEPFRKTSSASTREVSRNYKYPAAQGSQTRTGPRTGIYNQNEYFTSSPPTDRCYYCNGEGHWAYYNQRRPVVLQEQSDETVKYNLSPFISHDQDFEFECSSASSFRVDNLRRNLDFWKNTLNANNFVLNVVEFGYLIPFYKLPPSAFLKNNSSAIKHTSFVESSIIELLSTGVIREFRFKHTQWESLKHFSNPDLKALIVFLCSVVTASKSDNTLKKYKGYFKRFKYWCLKYNLLCLPTTACTVAIYLNF
ncbi:unnamed protein product [Mytilus edulis]|uniref:Uncharacterized protein n=1 Tax=Mytilus edulis TaxID=6550 RepID=A0A8S3RZ58_MYTED|nr:unnamed protein product [Mytilus edulis]